VPTRRLFEGGAVISLVSLRTLRRQLVATAVLVVVLAAPAGSRRSAVHAQAAAPSQPASNAQTPKPFRAGVNLVRVDVFPTLNGAAVRDLTKDDFDVFEDGAKQSVETFEHVDVRGPGPDAFRREPTSVRESREIGESGKSRIIVIFLDTYFVDLAGSHRMQRVLVNLLNRVVGPDDLFAVMTPQMSAKDISLARRTETVEGYLSKYWFWGQRDRLFPEDPVEQNYVMCYPEHDIVPGGEAFAGVAKEMIERRREKQVVDALDDLTKYLSGVRDVRKAVVAVTGGWVLFRPNLNLTRNGRAPIPPQIGTNPEGRVTRDPQRYTAHDVTREMCEHDRLNLAMLDNQQTFYELMDDANRANVSFYPVNALGLVAMDRQVNEDPLEGEIQKLVGEGRLAGPLNLVDVMQKTVAKRSENLEVLAENTDGLAVVNTNDLDKGIRRVTDDLTSYYLLGYYSTNTKLDGKFRKINVKVKRPGVDVRARRGYRAATEKEVEEAQTAAAISESAAPPTAVQSALNTLGGARPGVPVRTAVSYAPVGVADGSGARARFWVLSELDPVLARSGEWLGGGTVTVTVLGPDNSPVEEKTATLPAGQRALAVDLGEIAVPPGELVVRTRLAPAQEGLPYNDTIRIGAVSEPGRPLLLRRGPTTGIKYVPTADLQFRRTERLRMELPVAASVAAATGEVLDRAGKTMAVPVTAGTRTDGSLTWATAELNLAPLAAGDYVLRLKADCGGTIEEVVTGFRVVP
jgi:VWFA-related protein